VQRDWRKDARIAGEAMITFMVVKILDRIGTDEPSHYWYGAAFAFLFDVFLASVAWYWIRVWLSR
jgi:hypothetical protein